MTQDTTSLPGSGPVFVERPGDPGWPLRIIWFLLVGWWLSGLFIAVGWLLMVTIVLAPFGLWVLHRVPWAQTLRPRSGGYEAVYRNGQVVMSKANVPQFPFIIRLPYVVLIGWWLGAIWLAIAWALATPLITLPISVLMIDRSPFVVSLQRN